MINYKLQTTILISTGLFSIAIPALATIQTSLPAVPSSTNCQYNPSLGTTCGLYLDLSGKASASTSGSQSFSYQPSWNYTNYLYVHDSATDSGAASASVQATDFVTFGSLKSQLNSASSGSASPTYVPNAGSATNSTIGFQDRLTFNLAGAPAGTMGTMIGRINVSGNVGASSPNYPYGYASATAAVSASGGSGLISNSTAAYGDRPSTGGIPSYVTFQAPVKFNTPYFTLVFVQLNTTAQSGALSVPGQSFSATANADFFSSAEWSGIDSVIDANGNAITGWSVSSASGFDYTRSYAAQAVPEPSSYALLLVGLGISGFIVRRGKL